VARRRLAEEKRISDPNIPASLMRSASQARVVAQCNLAVA